MPNEVKKLTDFVNPELLTLFDKHCTASFQFSELLKAVTVCHRADIIVPKKDEEPKSDDIYKSFHRMEQAQLMFANSFGYRFIYRKNKLLTIADNNIQYRYQELFYFTIKRPDN